MNSVYYKGFSIKYDEAARDYQVLAGDTLALSERFGSLSYAYDVIDVLVMDMQSSELGLQIVGAY